VNDAPSLRETIETAMNADPVESTEPAQLEIPTDAPPVETSSEAPTTPTDTRVRDEEGKFAPKPKEQKKDATAPKAPGNEAKAPTIAAQGKPAGAAPPTSPAPAGEPVTPAVKAPQSWKPAAREAFAKAPPEVQQEVARREAEISRTLQETAQARQMASQVQQTLAPFEGLARANGMDSLKYAGSVMQTAAALHMGTPQQKAAIVAQLINTYGIDVDGVNAVMQGQAPAAQPQPPPQDVGKLVEQALQSRIQAATEQRAQSAWQEFEGSAPEFLESVKEDMREILMVAGQQGRNMTYQQAYDRACKLNEEVAAVLDGRKATAATRAQAPTVQRAKVAGSSIKAVPVGQAPGRDAGKQSLRETIDAAIAAQRT